MRAGSVREHALAIKWLDERGTDPAAGGALA